MVTRAKGNMFRRKVGGGGNSGSPGGSDPYLRFHQSFLFIGQMIVPGSSYWNVGIGRDKGEVENDAEGLATMDVLGQNMAWLLKKLHP